MALSPKLEIRQGQSLIMTPQLMQAIKLLQMSSLDLTSYVEAEMERNPLLERVEGDGPASDGAGGDAPEAGEAGGDRGESGGDDGEWIRSELSDSAQEIAGRLDTDLGNVYPDDPGTRAGPEAGASAGEEKNGIEAHAGTARPAIYLPLAGPSYQPATMEPRAGTAGQGYDEANEKIRNQKKNTHST